MPILCSGEGRSRSGLGSLCVLGPRAALAPLWLPGEGYAAHTHPCPPGLPCPLCVLTWAVPARGISFFILGGLMPFPETSLLSSVPAQHQQKREPPFPAGRPRLSRQDRLPGLMDSVLSSALHSLAWGCSCAVLHPDTKLRHEE